MKAAGIDPLFHFLAVGASEGRQPIAPSELVAANGFDFVYYLANNPDVAAAGVDPFWHFQNIGWKEGRDPNALFDTSGYLAAYTDVAAAHINPLDHYNLVRLARRPRPVGRLRHRRPIWRPTPTLRRRSVNPLTHFLHVRHPRGPPAVRGWRVGIGYGSLPPLDWCGIGCGIAATWTCAAGCASSVRASWSYSSAS